jgi:hypothetical protein
MQATELCAYVLSLDDPRQVMGVDVNEAGLRMDIRVGFHASRRPWLGSEHRKTCFKCGTK